MGTDSAEGASARLLERPVPSIRWQSGPGHFLVEGCERVAQLAEAVFAPWAPRGEGPEQLRRWVIEPRPDPISSGKTGWSVRSPLGDESIWASEADAVVDVEFRSAALTYGAHDEGFAFHGALVSRNEAGVLLLGPSHAGKSTLACALWSRGWVLHSDDGALIDPVTGWALPSTRRISVRSPSRSLLGEETWRRLRGGSALHETEEGFLCHPAERETGERARGVVLRQIVLVGRTEGKNDRSVDQLLAVAAHANGRAERAGHAFAAASRLMSAVSVASLAPGPLDRLVGRVEELLGALG